MKYKIYDGINIVSALQGEGKTYICTHKALYEIMNKNSRYRVFSNYPIIFKKPLSLREKVINKLLSLLKREAYTINILNKRITFYVSVEEKLSSYIWEDTLTQFPIKDCLIIIDESHDRYTGAYAYELNKDDRKFFSRLRHNGNSVYLMSQSYEDIHPFIRRRMAFLHEVSKSKWFWSKIPSSFTISTYNSIKSYLKKDDYKIHKKARKTIYSKERIKFTVLVGNAYNTHYYRDIRDEPEYKLWIDAVNENTPSTINVVTPKVSDNVIKDSIKGLTSLGITKKEAASLVYSVLENNDKVLSTEELIKIALKQKSQTFRFRDNEERNKEQEGSVKLMGDAPRR